MFISQKINPNKPAVIDPSNQPEKIFEPPKLNPSSKAKSENDLLTNQQLADTISTASSDMNMFDSFFQYFDEKMPGVGCPQNTKILENIAEDQGDEEEIHGNSEKFENPMNPGGPTLPVIFSKASSSRKPKSSGTSAPESISTINDSTLNQAEEELPEILKNMQPETAILLKSLYQKCHKYKSSSEKYKSKYNTSKTKYLQLEFKYEKLLNDHESVQNELKKQTGSRKKMKMSPKIWHSTPKPPSDPRIGWIFEIFDPFSVSLACAKSKF